MFKSKILKLSKIVFEAFLVTALLCILQLLDENMFRSNEVDVLPLAKQYIEPSWLPNDWYLNQPPSYRLLFQILIGKVIVTWGFLAGSIVGRIICYFLIGLGLVLIKRSIGLSLPLLLLAVFGFMANQSFAAGELIVSGVQAKVFSYGFVLIAIGLLLRRSYYWMALMLGLATSFHVLAGGWSFVTVVGLLILKWNACKMNFRYLGGIFLIYLISSSFSLKAVIDQLVTPSPQSIFSPSFIYVFLRLPHHLNPLSWSWTWVVQMIVYLGIMGLSILLLKQIQIHKINNKENYIASVRLFEFTLISLIPFIIGVAIAPFDSQGSLLQYYPFRVGSAMLPLNSCLLFGCAVDNVFNGKKIQFILIGSIFLLSLLLTQPIFNFKNQLLSLPEFPSELQQVSTGQKNLSNWVKNNTPKNALLITPPGSFNSFSWLAERSTVAKFKMFPQTKLGIIEWYERMRDLSGNNSTILAADQENIKLNKKGFELEKELDKGYFSLTNQQVNLLMDKYQSNYFVTETKHKLDLSIVYSNAQYIIYSQAK